MGESRLSSNSTKAFGEPRKAVVAAAASRALPAGEADQERTQQTDAERVGDAVRGGDGDGMLFIGFHPEELQVIRERLPELLPSPPRRQRQRRPSGTAAGGAARGGLQVVDVTSGLLSHTVRQVLAWHQQQGEGAAAAEEVHEGLAAGADADAAAVSAGRVVLLLGPVAEGLGAQLNDALAEWGVVPALIAAYQHKHEQLPLHKLVASLRDAHARYYGLLQPVRVQQLAEGGAPQGEAAAGAAADGDGNSSTAGEAPEAAAGHLGVLEDVRVVLTAAMDAGEVPSIHGAYRPDAGHVVVLDGLLTEAERAELLAWLTSPQHNHAGPPPGEKWEMSCVDRTGDQLTWGLQPHMLEALRDDPPPPVVALQSRLAALYPEYDICHMPADQVGDTAADPEAEEATSLSSFVGNAVMPGDPCAWHVDADPANVPPHSPWVHNFGYYHNRELGRPLFVSVLLYLNESWPEDYHAETLFLDPETQLGIFVRPVPGRVVLLEQDLPHRISAPSREAPGPRYSLVWKLVLVPRQEAGVPSAQRDGHGGGGDGGVAGPGGAAAFQSICRPEWGEPVRIGSACRGSGVRAYQRRRPGGA
ncbi:hypothetical protein GPECTOR_9g596 [Gonium pectorale]|uniref:Fe2OG dioxygenase domain-containing protein n=1 Tax=Gonium pectorale TaxID=33097 RepID=A0A150GS58_GONPE|nr:hypothetical protein GPECTOR_9g596 [Gonium pectorale]|eukprot:KXZ52552.1 hypothetical protein GPECTOR_9g596 [Gonium pectorale]